LDNKYNNNKKNEINNNNNNQIDIDRDYYIKNNYNIENKNRIKFKENINTKNVTFKEAYKEIQNGYNLEYQNHNHDFSSKK